MMDEPGDDEITQEEWEAFLRNASFSDLVDVMSVEEVGIFTELFLIYEETQEDPSERARRLADWHAMNDPDPASDHLQ